MMNRMSKIIVSFFLVSFNQVNTSSLSAQSDSITFYQDQIENHLTNWSQEKLFLGTVHCVEEHGGCLDRI